MLDKGLDQLDQLLEQGLALAFQQLAALLGKDNLVLPALEVFRTRLVGESPGFVDLLQERLVQLLGRV